MKMIKLMIFAVVLISSASFARPGGNTGVGAAVGMDLNGAGGGLHGKLWNDPTNAWNAMLNFSTWDDASNDYVRMGINIDYLWHFRNVVTVNGGGEIPLYVGVGGHFSSKSTESKTTNWDKNEFQFAFRVPFGITYEAANFPIDSFFEIALGFPFLGSDGINLGKFNGSAILGAHYYF